jgi:hypothetical protein
MGERTYAVLLHGFGARLVRVEFALGVGHGIGVPCCHGVLRFYCDGNGVDVVVRGCRGATFQVSLMDWEREVDVMCSV